MNLRFQAFLLVAFILISVAITRIGSGDALPSDGGIGGAEKEAVAAVVSPNVSFQRASMVGGAETARTAPVRVWSVLDPAVGAQAVMIQSIDTSFPFLNYHTYTTWPMASLTKLLTAVVVLEDIGADKKIPVSDLAVQAEGSSGGLTSGDVYTARDLVKIMLLASANDAAAAFEEYVGGRDAFVKLITAKIASIGMEQTIAHDASGLSTLNTSSASDLVKLTKYITEHDPEIFGWTRLQSFVAQPINQPESRTIQNINPFVAHRDFLGGKTGTLPDAKENLVALFSFNNYRIVVVMLGSPDRVAETSKLLSWLGSAYEF